MGVALERCSKGVWVSLELLHRMTCIKALQDGSITFDQFNDKLIELDGGVNGFASRAKTASDGIATAMTMSGRL